MKKRIDIYGRLEFPLSIGYAAFIQRQEGSVLTPNSNELSRK